METSRSDPPAEDSGFGPLLRRHRRTAGLTLEELSERAGISVRAIGDMERGRSRSPQARTVTALADALRLDATDRAAFAQTARAGRRRPRGPAAGRCVPPPDVPDFAGRVTETAWLLQGGPDTPVTVVSGAPGVGKSALVAHAARQAADRYGDGRLFLDLRGLDAEPVPPGEALRRLLRALGVRARDVPADVEERAALHRSLLRERRVLVILDNAADETQLRPLLPAPGQGAVWVTARRALTGLEHARRLPLRPLPAGAARAMLGSLLDGREGPPDPAALAEIAEHCGHLPLALRIAGTRLLGRPAWTPRDLAGRLAARERRLDALAAGDLRIRSAFALSHARLTREQRILFRRLALVPGPDFGGDLAAVLTGFPAHLAEQVLDDLVELGLLVPVRGDRAAFHDLLRLFAAELAREEEGAAEIRSVRARTDRWLLDSAREAAGRFAPGRADASTLRRARDWLEAEGENWFAAFRDAAREGRHETVVEVARALGPFAPWSVFRGRWPEVFTLSYGSARRLGDPRATAAQLSRLAWALLWCSGDAAASEAHASRAERLADEAGDTRVQGWALVHAGRAVARLGDGARASELAGRAAVLLRDAGDRAGRAQALLADAHAMLTLDRPEAASERLGQVVALLADPATAPGPHHARYIGAEALRITGALHERAGDWGAAAGAYEQALRDGPEVPVPHARALLLEDLARARHRLGDLEGARTARTEAHHLFTATGDTTGAKATRGLPDTATARGLPDAAAAPM